MSEFRRCCRPGCGKPAIATLTYAYAESTAVVGPLAAASEPHSWDLCEVHARKITAPLGWELVRYDLPDSSHDDDDLTALAEAVREAGRNATGLVLRDERELSINHVDANRHPSSYSVRESARKSAREAARAHLRVVPDLQENAEE
ncbi:DUF3499 domain-containing protein [Corynebacterium sp. H78]|uniref:DUF3499 domain-containing protein n=1 Tax=Corynebacterium sp. H78 TaxID=3133417 RepID=UPI00309AF76F